MLKQISYAVLSGVLLSGVSMSADAAVFNAVDDGGINFLRSQNTNLGASDVRYIGWNAPGATTDIDRVVAKFDLGNVPAASDGTLILTSFNNFNFNGYAIDAYLMSAANSDWVELEYTYNQKANGPTAWNGGAHDNGAVFQGSDTWLTGDGQVAITIPQATLNDIITNRGGIGSFLLKSDLAESQGGGTDHILGIYLNETNNVEVSPRIEFSVVPEPASMGVLALGSALLMRRRKA